MTPLMFILFLVDHFLLRNPKDIMASTVYMTRDAIDKSCINGNIWRHDVTRHAQTKNIFYSYWIAQNANQRFSGFPLSVKPPFQ
jgi:hypothetical protein